MVQILVRATEQLQYHFGPEFYLFKNGPRHDRKASGNFVARAHNLAKFGPQKNRSLRSTIGHCEALTADDIFDCPDDRFEKFGVSLHRDDNRLLLKTVSACR